MSKSTDSRRPDTLGDLRVDLHAVNRLLGALFEDLDRFFLGFYPDKEGPNPTGAAYREQSRQFTVADLPQILRLIDKKNREEQLAVAVSLGSFSPTRAERDLIALGAFGFDIDEDPDFGKLVPGATTVAEVLPEVLRRLAEVGLAPQAVVDSGHGLHVYVLIEPIYFKPEDHEKRSRVKKVWKKLAHLICAPDRKDLSSLLRLPGTYNRKYGGLVQARFIEEHTDLKRPRYKFEEIERALAHLPEPAVAEAKKKTADGKNKRDRKKTEAKSKHEPPELEVDPLEERILNAVLTIDKKLAKVKNESRNGGRSKSREGDSGSDYEYCRLLLEAGFSQAFITSELWQSNKARQSGEAYVDRTFQKVAEALRSPRSPCVPVTCSYESVSRRSLYSLENDPFEEPPQAPAPCGDSSARPAKVSIVSARPGDGKTTGAIHYLSQGFGLGYSRIGVCSQFVGELLLHGYVINKGYPYPIEDDGLLDLPNNASQLVDYLPPEVLNLLDKNGNRVWSEDRLSTISNPKAFYLNSLHPEDTDRRLDRLADWAVDRDLHPPPVDLHDRQVWQPQAVVKFKGTEDLCLAGHNDAKLKDSSVCKTCPFLSCGANTNPKGGAKTYWRDATVGLLAYKAFEVQKHFQPQLNNFDMLVLDEVPQLVYRHYSFKLIPSSPMGERTAWKNDLLDAIEQAFSKFKLSTTAKNEVSTVLKSARAKTENLLTLARKLRKEVLDGKRSGIEQRVWELPPLMSPGEFEVLVDHSGARALDPDAAAHVGDGNTTSKPRLTDLLMELADFVGDGKPLKVILQHTFDKSGGGGLLVCRPVDGWADLLKNPDGSIRDLAVLDATARVDPRYMLIDPDGEEVVQGGSYPNTTVVLSSEKTIPRKTVKGEESDELYTRIVSTVGDRLKRLAKQNSIPGGVPYEPKVLVVTALEAEDKVRKAVEEAQRDGLLPAVTTVDHFGNLRGKNDYRDYDAVVFTNLHRYDELYYPGIAMLLDDFDEAKYGGQWHHKSATDKSSWNPKLIRYRSQFCDIAQDLLRIGVRSDPKRPALMFVPTSEAPFIVRLMKLLHDARFELADGTVLLDHPEAVDAGIDDLPDSRSEIEAEMARHEDDERRPRRRHDVERVDEFMLTMLLSEAKARPGFLMDGFEPEMRAEINRIPMDRKIAALEGVNGRCPDGVPPEQAAADVLLSDYIKGRPRRWS